MVHRLCYDRERYLKSCEILRSGVLLLLDMFGLLNFYQWMIKWAKTTIELSIWNYLSLGGGLFSFGTLRNHAEHPKNILATTQQQVKPTQNTLETTYQHIKTICNILEIVQKLHRKNAQQPPPCFLQKKNLVI